MPKPVIAKKLTKGKTAKTTKQPKRTYTGSSVTEGKTTKKNTHKNVTDYEYDDKGRLKRKIDVGKDNQRGTSLSERSDYNAKDGLLAGFMFGSMSGGGSGGRRRRRRR